MRARGYVDAILKDPKLTYAQDSGYLDAHGNVIIPYMSPFRRAWLHIKLNFWLECEAILFKQIDLARMHRRNVVYMLGKHYKLTDKYDAQQNDAALESDKGAVSKPE